LSECRHWTASSLSCLTSSMISQFRPSRFWPSLLAMSDPSTGASADTLKTRAGKRKAPANLTPLKKARKTTGKSTGGIKINEPAPNALASTPPSYPRWKIPIQRLKRYACQEYVSSLTIFLFVSLCAECPRTSTRTPLRRVLRQRVPKGGQAPSPKVERTTPYSPKPSSPKGV
jgi:hypothetical protein